MMRRVPWLVLLAGCEIWNGPDKVNKLEGRVDELSAELSALTGKAVGAGKAKEHGDAHETKPADKHEAKPDDHGDKHEAKADDKKVEDKPEHGERKADGKKEPKDVDASEGKIDLGSFHPEKKGSVAELSKRAGIEPAPEDKHEKPHWDYEGPLKAWGELAEEWKTCSKGKQQSPIDIAPHAAAASEIEFHYKPTAAAIVDNGHTGQVNVAPGSSIEIDKHSYQLVQFHTHTPSEHTIAGERFPLEVHLVHKDADGKLAVIGVMYEEGADTKALVPLYTKWPTKKEAESKLGKVDPLALLPANHSVYRYSGSLTTPPCTEGVVWNVMRRPMSETKPHLAAIAGHYKNARSVQLLGDRKVQ